MGKKNRAARQAALVTAAYSERDAEMLERIMPEDAVRRVMAAAIAAKDNDTVELCETALTGPKFTARSCREVLRRMCGLD